MDKQIFQIPAIMTKVNSMAHWWRIQFDTQENIPSEKMAVVLDWMNKLGWLTFSIRLIDAQDILDLPEIKTDDTKTPGQRLRAVLYRGWERNKEGHDTFTTYYESKMEKLINYYKEKLL
jgi:hypothetical protein